MRKSIVLKYAWEEEDDGIDKVDDSSIAEAVAAVDSTVAVVGELSGLELTN